MARIRTIKPEFFLDEKVGNLPIQARLLFIGLWCHADDNGVLRGNAAYIKAQVFPYDDNLRVGEVKKWIDALVEARMLIPLTYKGESYYVVRTFRSHQKIDPRYTNELIPEAEYERLMSHGERTASARRAHGERTALEMEVEMDNIPPYNPPLGENKGPSIESCVDNGEKRKEKVARKRKETDLSFVEPTFQPIMADWLAYKSERGQTYRDRGLRQCYTRLCELSGGDPDKASRIVKMSIANNYSGLFPLKDTDYGIKTDKNRQPSDDELARAVAEGFARAHTPQEWEQ